MPVNDRIAIDHHAHTPLHRKRAKEPTNVGGGIDPTAPLLGEGLRVDGEHHHPTGTQREQHQPDPIGSTAKQDNAAEQEDEQRAMQLEQQQWLPTALHQLIDHHPHPGKSHRGRQRQPGNHGHDLAPVIAGDIAHPRPDPQALHALVGGARRRRHQIDAPEGLVGNDRGEAAHQGAQRFP